MEEGILYDLTNGDTQCVGDVGGMATTLTASVRGDMRSFAIPSLSKSPEDLRYEDSRL